MSVTLHENDGPATIKVGIDSPNYKESKNVDLSPSQTEVLHFDIPNNLKSDSYTLETEGLKGITFKNSTNLVYKARDPKVYIQTDKAIYKPGDLVQYRVLVLDENTKPAKLEQSLRLGFRDGAGNFVKEVKDLKLNKGVFIGEFQLSEQPVLGRWSMQVLMSADDDNAKVEKNFLVDKYVLPKFSVDIDTAKDIAFDEDTLKVTVRSKYTYNKPVKGKATIVADTRYGQVRSNKVIDIFGKGQAEFDLVQDLSLSPPQDNQLYDYYYVPPINILAIVTEEQTGNSRNATATVNIHRSRYNIVVENNVYDYVVNKPFIIKAYVKNLDGSPVQNSKHMAKLVFSRNYNYNVNYQPTMPSISTDYVFTSELDKNGMAVFKVTIPSGGYFSNNRIEYANKVLHLPFINEKQETNTKIDENIGPLKLVLKTEK